MKILKSILAITVLALSTSSAMAAEFPDVSLEQLEKAIDAKSVVILDVNGSKSYANGHIPSAIDFSSVKNLSAKLPKDKNALIVAYCGGPRCSAYKKAATAAKKLGYTNVKHLSAGISGWKDAGKPLGKASSN